MNGDPYEYGYLDEVRPGDAEGEHNADLEEWAGERQALNAEYEAERLEELTYPGFPERYPSGAESLMTRDGKLPGPFNPAKFYPEHGRPDPLDLERLAIDNEAEGSDDSGKTFTEDPGEPEPGQQIYCCEWVDYPTPGNDTACKCGSTFAVRPEPEAGQ